MNILDDDVRKIVDDLSLVYWQEISKTDPSYVEAINILKGLCEKYGITYRSSVSEILGEITNGKYEGYTNFLESLKNEIATCSSVDAVSSTMWKISSTRDEWREAIASYVTNYGKLFDILDGKLETIDGNVSNILPREVRLVPQEKFLYDEHGWPVLDNDGYEITVLESEQEAEERVEAEDRRYEEMIQQRDSLRASLPSWMEYLFALPEISMVYKTLEDSLLSVGEIKQKLILDDYSKDLEFMGKLDDIMEHDSGKCEYLYHGTTCVEEARNILEKGLYVRSDDLGLTTYSEFSKEDLLLYNRGFMGEIGSSAVVIIKKPKYVDIVRETTESEKAVCSAVPSGLAGLDCDFDYIVPKEYIVGYVDKIDRQVVYQKDFSLSDRVSTSK